MYLVYALHVSPHWKLILFYGLQKKTKTGLSKSYIVLHENISICLFTSNKTLSNSRHLNASIYFWSASATFASKFCTIQTKREKQNKTLVQYETGSMKFKK